MEKQLGICDVHALVHGDKTPRTITFCGMCKAWLCDDCRGRYDLRAIAAMKQKALSLLKRLKEGA